jgi:ABC-type transport system involved in multi-copper enzyme maturation permease subunit
MSLLRVEIERSLRRRMVWSLLAVALAGIALFGIIAFVSSAGLDVAALDRRGETHPAVLRHWWTDDGGDTPLGVAGIFLLAGGLIGGAGVVGGEWRSGNLATLLTWEPRRGRVLAARLGAITVCSFALAVLLQGLLLAALTPAVVGHGTTAGAGASLAGSVALAGLRIASLTAAAALLGACGAWVSRNTAVGIVAVLTWLAIAEPILRTQRPGFGTYLVGENLARVLTWRDLGGPSQHIGPAHASVVILLLLLAAVALASVVFRRTDATAA